MRSKLGGVDTSILHHDFISIFIALWGVITRYVTILMAILSYFTRFIMEIKHSDWLANLVMVPKKDKSWRDTSILHHAFISIFIALWAVITCYVTILTAILSYFTRFIMKRENASS